MKLFILVLIFVLMQGLGQYFGNLVNQAFGSLRRGVENAGQTANDALTRISGGIIPRPAEVQRPVVSPLPDNYQSPGSMTAQQAGEHYNPGLEDYFRSQLGPANQQTTNLQDYYPVLQNLGLLRQKEEQLNRPGLADLLALQALFESTGGRSSPNAFGVLPGGEGAGRSPSFGSIPEAVDYQVGPNVLGGGQGGKLNLLRGQVGEITPAEITNLYSSYDPHFAYLQQLLKAYQKIRGM